jgi:Putative peptidoglycan binding domain
MVVKITDSFPFRPVTKQGILSFQRQQTLTPTGDADPATLSLLIRRVRTSNSEHNDSSLAAERLSLLDRTISSKLLEKSRGQLPNRAARGSGYGLSSSTGTGTPKKSSGVEGSTIRRSNSTLEENVNMMTPNSSRPPSRAEETPPSSVPPTPPTPGRNSSISSSSSSTEPPPKRTAPDSGLSNEGSTLFEQVYLRIPTHHPVWVYCSEIQEKTTLVVISKGLVSHYIK